MVDGLQGGNLLLVADANASDLMRDIAGQFGVDFDRKKTRVIDHFSFEPALDTRCVRLHGGAIACLLPN